MRDEPKRKLEEGEKRRHSRKQGCKVVRGGRSGGWKKRKET